ncbi:MAG: hypothetical protein ACYDBQ_01220 [Thermoplasmatota archaeon]
MTTNEALQTFAKRPKGLRNPAIKEFAESILENVANQNINDADLLPFILDTLRVVDLRIEPYVNAPIKGVVSIPLEDPSLDAVREALAVAITSVMRRAYREAALKVLVDQQPG